MATIEHWNKYMNLLHEFALVEDDLRDSLGVADAGYEQLARNLLREHFGVDTP